MKAQETTHQVTLDRVTLGKEVAARLEFIYAGEQLRLKSSETRRIELVITNR